MHSALHVVPSICLLCWRVHGFRRLKHLIFWPHPAELYFFCMILHDSRHFAIDCFDVLSMFDALSLRKRCHCQPCRTGQLLEMGLDPLFLPADTKSLGVQTDGSKDPQTLRPFGLRFQFLPERPPDVRMHLQAASAHTEVEPSFPQIQPSLAVVHGCRRNPRMQQLAYHDSDLIEMPGCTWL